MINLNTLTNDNNYISNDVHICFNNIENIIIDKINKYDVIIGCVAWITNKNILNALLQKSTVMIVVQEEDYLLPDNNTIFYKNSNKRWIRDLYTKLQNCNKYEYNIRHKLGINIYSSSQIAGVRRYGLMRHDSNVTYAKMHNKFIIGLNLVDSKKLRWSNSDKDLTNFITSGEVITGSYNYTYSGSCSLENIICLTDINVLNAYFKQFGDIYVNSYELNFPSPWLPTRKSVDTLYYDI